MIKNKKGCWISYEEKIQLMRADAAFKVEEDGKLYSYGIHVGNVRNKREELNE